jgi:hypothetical protein
MITSPRRLHWHNCLRGAMSSSYGNGAIRHLSITRTIGNRSACPGNLPIRPSRCATTGEVSIKSKFISDPIGTMKMFWWQFLLGQQLNAKQPFLTCTRMLNGRSGGRNKVGLNTRPVPVDELEGCRRCSEAGETSNLISFTSEAAVVGVKPCNVTPCI